MSVSAKDRNELDVLDAKLKAILPAQYHDCYKEVLPTSMGSATLKLGPDGRVAWDEMWTTFCDLAIAGGPPHRGTLLQPASVEEMTREPEKYQQVVSEIARGIFMATGLWVQTFPMPGWIGVRCQSVGMAGWLVRAIVAENVRARHHAETLYLPVGPSFRLEKEVKNVVTVIAKASHYWMDHTPSNQQESIAVMMKGDTPGTELLEPASPVEVYREPQAYQRVVDDLTQNIQQSTGLICRSDQYVGWVGVECSDDRTAIWLMRAMIVENILCRREESTLFLPAGPRFADDGRCDRILVSFNRAHHLWTVHLALRCSRDVNMGDNPREED